MWVTFILARLDMLQPLKEFGFISAVYDGNPV